MKIAVSATGNHLDSPLDPRFGRCAYFVIVETEDMDFEAFENQSISLGGGAGIQAAQFVASQGVRAVITGNCGPNAVRTLAAAAVDLVTGEGGTVREVAERYKRGDLKTTTAPNVADHYGMGEAWRRQRPAAGTGMGMGRRVGGGRGMGCGRGMGRGLGAAAGGSVNPVQGDSPPMSRERQLDSLKEQATDLMNMVEDIQQRIKTLEDEP